MIMLTINVSAIKMKNIIMLTIKVSIIKKLFKMKTILLIFLVAFVSCNTEVQEPDLEFDINGLIKCITEVAPLVPDVVEIISLIKVADWAQVAVKAVELVTKGIPAVKDCIAAFKKEFNLEIPNPTSDYCRYKCKNEKTEKEKKKCFAECCKYAN